MPQVPGLPAPVERLLRELYDAYNTVVRDLASFLQEIPGDLLLQADRIEEQDHPGLTQDEIANYANGVRFAAQLVAMAIAAHMEVDQAQAEGEFDDPRPG